MTRDQVISTIAQRIGQFEGFYLTQAQAKAQGSSFPTFAQRNNNPGNLRSWGSNPIVGGYAQFPNVEAGWTALRRQVGLNIDKGLTFLEFFGGKPGVYYGYAPAADSNHPVTYANYVAAAFGVPASTKILDFIAASSAVDQAGGSTSNPPKGAPIRPATTVPPAMSDRTPPPPAMSPEPVNLPPNSPGQPSLVTPPGPSSEAGFFSFLSWIWSLISRGRV